MCMCVCELRVEPPFDAIKKEGVGDLAGFAACIVESAQTVGKGIDSRRRDSMLKLKYPPQKHEIK